MSSYHDDYVNHADRKTCVKRRLGRPQGRLLRSLRKQSDNVKQGFLVHTVLGLAILVKYS